MVKRRIKRNFDEQLATVSSLTSETCTLQNQTNDETKPTKKRTWHRNRVWRKDDPQTKLGGDPRVKDLPNRPTKVKVDNVDEQLATVSCHTAHTSQNRTRDETKPNKKRTWYPNRVWRKNDPQTQVGEDPRAKDLSNQRTMAKVDTEPNKNRTWYCNRVWRKDDPQTKLGGDPWVKDVPEKPTKVKVNSGPRRWRYNRIWRRDFVWKKENPKKSCSDSSQGVVPTSKTAPTTASISKTTSNTDPISNAAPTTASTSKSVTSLSVAPTSGAAVSEASSIYAHREKVVSKAVTDSNKKTVTTTSNTGNGEVTIFNDNLGCHAKMASITATPCSPPLKTHQSSPSAEEKENRKSPKRKRPETRSVPNKRVRLKQSADDTRLSCRWLWSVETLMERLCLAFEGVFL
ncbi:TRIO and F-actin-binding protein-like isoform X1 [Magallana gigas]|uniref:TRIO and F-actin-binding protein-like isoform X1 n=1 Tax=Magallana gigas TaxID=29159 RepID=UPI00333F0CA9